MSNTISQEIEPLETATIAGRWVEVVEVESTDYGTQALVRDEDGREDWVPYVRLNFN